MNTLLEIEAAADALSVAEKQELLFFLAGRLRAERVPFPEPRIFSAEQIDAWIAQDEADMKRFLEGKKKS